MSHSPPSFAERAAHPGAVAPAESPVVETGGALRVLGVTWPEGTYGARDRVEIRQRDEGTWGSWAPLDAEEEHAPDPGTAEAERALGVLTWEVGQAGDGGLVPAGGVGSVVVVLV